MNNSSLIPIHITDVPYFVWQPTFKLVLLNVKCHEVYNIKYSDGFTFHRTLIIFSALCQENRYVIPNRSYLEQSNNFGSVKKKLDRMDTKSLRQLVTRSKIVQNFSTGFENQLEFICAVGFPSSSTGFQIPCPCILNGKRAKSRAPNFEV